MRRRWNWIHRERIFVQFSGGRAIVHPAIATLPVFVLGVIAALAFERSRSLLSSMLVHMTYNAVVIGFAGMHLT